MNTWEVVHKGNLASKDGKTPKIIPTTWAFRIKRYPDGRINKFKARFCVRGDRMVKNEDYFESWSPTASWSTVRMLMTMTLQHDWCIKQADFDNAFVQAPLDRDVYVTLPRLFEDQSGLGNDELFLKLNKSLYGQADAPRN